MIVGMLIGVLGFIAGAVADYRELGRVVFIIGFLIATSGIIWGIAGGGKSVVPGISRWISLLLAIGFGVLVAGALVSFAGGPDSISTVALAAGFAAMFVGIGAAILSLLRR